MDLDMTTSQVNSSSCLIVFGENKNRFFMFYLADRVPSLSWQLNALHIIKEEVKKIEQNQMSGVPKYRSNLEINCNFKKRGWIAVHFFLICSPYLTESTLCVDLIPITDAFALIWVKQQLLHCCCAAVDIFLKRNVTFISEGVVFWKSNESAHQRRMSPSLSWVTEWPCFFLISRKYYTLG